MQRATVVLDVLRIAIASFILLSSLKMERVIACRSTSTEPSKDPVVSGSTIDTHTACMSRFASWVGAYL